jgi:hypothetical protein
MKRRGASRAFSLTGPALRYIIHITAIAWSIGGKPGTGFP